MNYKRNIKSVVVASKPVSPTTFYQDALDNSRLLKIIRVDGNHTVCGVYWKKGVGNPIYGGTTRILSKMISGDASRTGFYPESQNVDNPVGVLRARKELHSYTGRENESYLR